MECVRAVFVLCRVCGQGGVCITWSVCNMECVRAVFVLWCVWIRWTVYNMECVRAVFVLYTGCVDKVECVRAVFVLCRVRGQAGLCMDRVCTVQGVWTRWSVYNMDCV